MRIMVPFYQKENRPPILPRDMIRWSGTFGALRGWPRFVAAVMIGALAAAAMPPLDAWPVLFIAFPALIRLIDGIGSTRGGFVVGWSFGLGYFAVALHWIGFAFLVEAETYLWMMPFAVGGLAGLMALYWGLAVALAQRLWSGGPGRIITLAACFALAEWLRGHLLTGFPWASLGLAADGMGALDQAAALVGMNGLAFLIVLWAGLPAVLFDRRGLRLAFCLAALLPGLWLWGEWRLGAADQSVVADVRLRIVQPNIPQSDKWREGNAAAIFEKLLALSRETTPRRPDGIAGITHLVWPESAVPFLVDEDEAAQEALAAALPDESVLVLGALRRDSREPGKLYNSILGFDGFGNLVLRYDKWRLVPWGEFLPLGWLLEPLGLRRMVQVPGSFTAGSGPVTLPVPGAPPAGPLVCYEAIFPGDLVDAAERPGWLINVTNDGWFGRSSGPYQHLAQARMRAIEQGLPLVRSANTGISAVIDGYGRILERLPLGAAGIIDAALPRQLDATPYARLGDAILFAAIALALLGAALRPFV